MIIIKVIKVDDLDIIVHQLIILRNSVVVITDPICFNCLL